MQRFGRAMLPALAALAGVVAFAALTEGGRHTRAGQALSAELDGVAAYLGLRIDQVAVFGHRFTPDGDIFEALDLANARTLPGFDSVAARERIEKLPWIATATITRILPGRLEVHVTERRPYAVWQRSGKEYLIDATGRLLAAVPSGSAVNLPRIAGEGAAAETPALMATLSRYPAIAGRLQVAERVAERRWTLLLNDNVELRLPAEAEAPTLERLSASGNLLKLLDGRDRVVDARVPGRITVRSRAEGASGPFRTSELRPATGGEPR